MAIHKLTWVLLSALLIILLCSFTTAEVSCTRPAATEQSLKRAPTAEAYARSAEWFQQHHKYECAAQDFEVASTLNPQSQRLVLRWADSLRDAGNLVAAEKSLRHAVALNTQSTEAHVQLAAVLEQLQRPEEAQSEWSAALKLDPKSRLALDGMAKHLINQGNLSAAIDLLQSGPSDDQLTIDLARAYAQAGSLPDAESVLRKRFSENPSSFELTRALVGVLVDEHAAERTFDEPVRIAEKFSAAHPENSDAQKLLLQLLLAWVPSGGDTGQIARATPLARRLLASHPNDPYVLYANGMLEQQAGNYTSAKSHLTRSIELDPTSDEAHYHLGIALAALNDPAGAQQEFEKAISLGDKQPEVRFQLSKVLRAMGKTDEANQQLKLYSDQTAALSNRRIAKLKEGQADNEFAQGHAAQAVALYREALNSSPDDALLTFKFATALDKAGDTAGEKSALEKAIQLDPGLAAAHNQLGYLASRSGDSAAAEKHFRDAVHAAPAYAEAWVNLAATLGMESKISEARQAIASALQADPNNTAAKQLQQELNAAQP